LGGGDARGDGPAGRARRGRRADHLRRRSDDRRNPAAGRGAPRPDRRVASRLRPAGDRLPAGDGRARVSHPGRGDRRMTKIVLVAGVVGGGQYARSAFCLCVTYRASKVLNLAQGAVWLAAATTFAMLDTWPTALAAAAAIAVAMAIG